MLLKVTNTCVGAVARHVALYKRNFRGILSSKGIKVGLKVLPVKRSKIIDEKFITPNMLKLMELGALRIETLDGRPYEKKSLKIFKDIKPVGTGISDTKDVSDGAEKIEAAEIKETEEAVSEDTEVEKKIFSEDELLSMTRSEIIALAKKYYGCEINKRSKIDCIEEFLNVQESL